MHPDASKWKFLGEGGEVQNNSFRGGGVYIFWNYIIYVQTRLQREIEH